MEISGVAEERKLRQLSSYLEFGVRLHWEDFTQLTAGALLVYLPVSLIVIFIHPQSVDPFNLDTTKIMTLLPRMLLTLFLLRVAQTLVQILILMRIDSRRKSSENIWDVSEAVSRLVPVALVDLAYVLGLAVLLNVVLWVTMLISRIVLGENPFGGWIAMGVTTFILIGTFVRYYFASYVALFRGTNFVDSFRGAAALIPGGERLVISLLIPFFFLWFVVWVVSTIIFGGGIKGALMFQAGVMTTSIPYFIASYLIFFDLAPPETDEGPAGGGQIPGVIDPFESDPLESEPGGKNPEENFPPAE